ncbi:cupin domain-containing protein [uncultured Rhodoblastus sp.]|uniref:cupin domain-containing protein n=1 Tax=uncultured Rhodoblastus sp. TaxID=543037 RepID=UPI0025E6F6D6|nr:cupin domain-containing protein [uncultured Rhodoblastus sp.]
MKGQDQDRDMTAAAYAIGLLSDETYDAAAATAREDRQFADEIAAWEQRLAPLAGGLAPVPPPADMLAKIEARLDAETRDSLNCRVTRADEGQWVELEPGVRIKVLHRKPEIGRQTYLLELAAGATSTLSHDHDDDEECFVVSGDIAFGDTLLGPGDYHLAPKGALHGKARSSRGCVCVIVAAMN